jgi:hypothetical protein
VRAVTWIKEQGAEFATVDVAAAAAAAAAARR